jgi:SAM-dependent methyltransferase
MYDAFSTDYDRFVDWQGRLASELPFIERRLRTAGAHRVIDAACGTGMHAIALARRGYHLVGTDLSSGMIEQARDNAAAAEVDARFEVVGFGELAETLILSRIPGEGGRLGAGPTAPPDLQFDALLCLGNSLPHLLTPDDLRAALTDFAACLHPGGLLLIQNRNFDAVLARRERWMAPQTHQDDDTEWIFLRFYDFEHDGHLTFNVVTLQRQGTSDWKHQVVSTRLWPQTQRELTQALAAADFREIAYFGDLQGSLFDASTSPNLVVTARTPAGEQTIK